MVRANIMGLLRRPLVVAPMAGGPSTVELVTAASAAGALGFLPAGYVSADTMAGNIAAVRAGTGEAFGVNVFVPGDPPAEPPGQAAAVARYLVSLRADADALGVTPGEPSWDDDGFEEKIAVLLTAAVPVVSFTFGCPSREVIAALQERGSTVVVTVTAAAEATLAAARGADGLCVQGAEAGAHQGGFTDDPSDSRERPLRELLEEVSQVSDLPLIAAGGIMSAEQVHEVMAAGAVAAQCGTALLRCAESGAHPAYKAALADPRFTATALTRAFSGRRARGLVNRFLLDHADAPAAYPEINNVTRPLRGAAAARGDTERMSLWAGTGWRSATDRPAGEVIEGLCSRAHR